MNVGDRVRARGPLGQFTMRSLPETPLLFVAGGTGFAPILALLRQQIRFNPRRDMVLVWRMKQAQDFYAIQEILALRDQAPQLRITLAAELGASPVEAGQRLSFTRGTVVDVLAQNRPMLADRDIYTAGPSVMLRTLVRDLDRWGVPKERVHLDSFSV